MQDPRSDGTWKALSAHALWLTLAFAISASAAARLVAAAPLGAEMAACLLSLPLLAWAAIQHKLDGRRVFFLTVAAIPLAVLFVSSNLSVDPRAALLGRPPLWQGWVLWATALGWLAVAVVAARPKDLRLLVTFLSVGGSVIAVWMLAESANLLSVYDPDGGPAMAIFDNSLSAAQFLVLSISATACLALQSRFTRTVRLMLWSALAVQIGALIASEARAAIVAMGVGFALFVAAGKGAGRLRRLTRVTACIVLIACLVIALVLALTSEGVFGKGAFDQANGVLSGRLGIWRDASVVAGESPLLGRGPGEFESIWHWEALEDGRIESWITDDPHNFLLAWYTDAGLVGLLALLAAATLVALALVRSATGTRADRSVRSLAAGLAALFVAMLGSWSDPISVLAASLLAGSTVSVVLMGQPDARWPAIESKWAPRAAAMAAGMAALISFVALVPAATAHYDASGADSYGELAQDLDRAYAETHDVTYLDDEMSVVNAAGPESMPDAEAIALVRQIATRYPDEARNDTELPLLSLEVLWLRSSQLDPKEYWSLSRFYARCGMVASPDNGVWKYALARAAHTIGRADQSVHIADALTGNVPPSAAALLEAWRREAAGPHRD